jgi:hypothetical protein
MIEAFDSQRRANLRASVNDYLPAIACALIPIFCYFVIRPFAEIGMNDDWSYIKTAQVLAQTGRIVYNGWATTILGWQVYLGALSIKLLGFSFSAVRFATVIESMATAFLLQRVFVRAGLNSWNATLATMTFILSPLCLPLEFTFMTDVSGVLCILVCLYMCLRAVEAESERSAMVWTSLAALLNAGGGTARQIAWLGVLVMVPSTLWLLRRNRRVLVVGCISFITGAYIVWATMAWFAGQPYTLALDKVPLRFDLGSLEMLGEACLRAVGQLLLFALPVLLMFTASLRITNRRGAAIFAAGFLCFAIPGVALLCSGTLSEWLAPFISDYMTSAAFERLKPIVAHGLHFFPARGTLRVLLTGVVVLGILSLVCCSFVGVHRRPAHPQAATAISWQKLGFILGPFSLAYVALLASNILRLGYFFDRYLIPLLAILLFALARFYQERVQAKLPWACAMLIAIFGAFSVAATHDLFTLYRGYETAIGRLLSSGTPATAILGPWEFEGWTEVEKVGHVNQPLIQVPQGAFVLPPVRSLPEGCAPASAGFLVFSPAIQPVYAVVLDPTQCGGQGAFPPVTYTTWFAPHLNLIYAVRLPVTSPG